MQIPGSKRRWLVVGLVAVSVLAVIRWQDRAGPFLSYQLVDERTILVDVFAPDVGWTRVTGVVESSTEVTITVSTIEFQFGPGFANVHQAALTVTLKDPLGSRAVIDASSGGAVRPLDCAETPSDWGWCAGWSPRPAHAPVPRRDPQTTGRGLSNGLAASSHTVIRRPEWPMHRSR